MKVLTPHRVLFVVTSSDTGGTENIILEIVSRMDRHSFEPILCTLRPAGRIAERIAAAGVEVHDMGMSERPRLAELVRGARRLARLLDELEIDLVQSFLYRANVVAALAARLSRCKPVVVTAQRSLRPKGGRLAALAQRLTSRLAHRTVAVSRAVRREMIESEGVPASKIVLIENGVDAERYHVENDGEARAGYGVKPGATAIGAVGRLTRVKGFHRLIDGIATARERGLDVQLLVAGDGPERHDLEDQARSLGLNGHVRFLGVQSDVRELYSAIDVFVLSSLKEGSPNALLEAMSCGRAIVATTVGGVPELVEHESSALLIAPDSAEEIADAIERVVTDSQLRSRLGSEARQRVLERFHIAKVVEQHADLYRELLEQRRTSTR